MDRNTFLGGSVLGVLVRLIILSIVVGVVLSTLHQSSLGSLYLIMPQKLNPLWYSPLLPVYFFFSAVAVGLAMVMTSPTTQPAGTLAVRVRVLVPVVQSEISALVPRVVL